MVNPRNTEQFWEWFRLNCNNFGDRFDNPATLRQLDQWVNRLGKFSWELGPGKKEEKAFIISPNGDPDLVCDTKAIITSAPPCTGWEFHYSKPPKEWNLKFNFKTKAGSVCQVDASEWQYCLLKYEDGMFEVIICAPEMNQLDEVDKLTAAEIALDGILGEEWRMRVICSVEVVAEFEEQYKSKATSMKHLQDHLSAISR